MKLPILSGFLGLAGTVAAAAGPAVGPEGDVTNYTALGLLGLAFISILTWVLKELPKPIRELVIEVRKVNRSVLLSARVQAEYGYQLGTSDAQTRGLRTDQPPDAEGLNRAERLYAQWARRQETIIEELGRMSGGGEGA